MSVSESDLAQPGRGAAPPPGGPRSSGRGPRRRRWLLGAVGALLVTAVVIAGVLAATYQPVSFGGASGGAFPGVPTGTGLRSVNDFGAATGDIYVPPQLGSFGLTQSIENTGPLPVTIESVTALPPNGAGTPTWPLVAAGPALYRPEYGNQPAAGRPVRGLSLQPGQAIQVGIPVRMTYPCVDPSGWTGLDVLYVQERFLTFTHWVAVPLGIPLIFREPEPGARSICPSR
jgi:hypothetical protein